MQQMQLRLLNEELRRTSAYESACRLKDEQAVELRAEVAALQRRLRHAEQGLRDLAPSDVQQRLLEVNREVSARKVDAHTLRMQVCTMHGLVPTTRFNFNYYFLSCVAMLCLSLNSLL